MYLLVARLTKRCKWYGPFLSPSLCINSPTTNKISFCAFTMKLLVWAGLFVYCNIPGIASAVPQPPTNVVCTAIAQAISSASEVFYPGELEVILCAFHDLTFFLGDPLYDKGIFHAAISSTQHSKCVVEAGTPEDVGKIVGLSSYFMVRSRSFAIFFFL